jgi:hypothetical protein
MQPSYNISSINEKLYGELLLLHDIHIENKEDKTSFAYGTVKKLQAKPEPEHLTGGEKGPEGDVTKWELVDYTGSLDFK